MKIMLDKNEHMFYNANKCNITVSGTIILLKYGVLWKQIREMCREDMEMSERNVKFQYFGLVRQEKEGNRWTGKGKLNISVIFVITQCNCFRFLIFFYNRGNIILSQFHKSDLRKILIICFVSTLK